MADWSPATYLRFEDERTRPARDLLDRVPLDRPSLVVDIGCGPGNSTELLKARFPDARLTGLDSSPAMLEEARRRLPGTGFELADVATWEPATAPDLVFANAVLQWVPGHVEVIARLFGLLAPGGVLAVQMPDNLAEPTHKLMSDVARSGSWAGRLADAARQPLPDVGVYYDRLAPEAARLDLWHTIYNHPLDGAAAIVDWVRSTGLKPFLDPLTEAERQGFLADYTARIARAYPPRTGGKVLLRFPRLFLVAVKP